MHKLYLSIVCLFFFLSQGLAQPFPVNINLQISPPYPLELERYLQYENNVVVTVTNTTATTQHIKFRGSMIGNNGFSVQTDPNFQPAQAFILEPFESQTLTGEELEELNINLTEPDIQTDGMSPQDRQRVLINRILPEGDYQVCISAFDYDNDMRLSSESPMGCSDFEVVFPGRPDIIVPGNESEVPVNPTDQVIFSWTPPGSVTPTILERTRYRIKVVDLTPYPLLSPTEAMLDPAVDFLINEDDIEMNTYIMEDEDLIEGHVYGVRVTAYDEEGAIDYQFDGHSEVVSFYYGTPGSAPSPDCTDPDYSISAVFPMDGDTLPFRFFPCVARVDPYCDSYRNFQFDFNVSGNGGNHHRTDNNGWPQGPLHYLQNNLGLSTADEFRAKHFFFNRQTEQVSDFGTLERGNHYVWNVNTTMTNQGGSNYTDNVPNQDMVYGMTKPNLQFPENNSTVDTGNVEMSWLPNMPNELLPEIISLIRADGNNILGPAELEGIDETFVLQVARDREFTASSIVTGETNRITLNSFYSEADIMSEVYRIRLFNHRFTEEGDYYWRVVWMKNPNGPIPSDFVLSPSNFYHESGIYKFSIDGDVEGGGTPEDGGPDPATAETNCETNCEMEAISNTTPLTSLEGRETIRVGYFSMEDIETTSSAGGQFTGTGIIRIPFLDSLKIKVEFTNLRVNTDGYVFNGNVTAKADEDFSVTEINSGLGMVTSLAESQVSTFEDRVNGLGHIAAAIIDDRPLGVPIGYDDTIEGHELTIGITSITFEPRRAYFSLLYNHHFDKLGEGNYISFGGSGICIKPDGIGQEFILHFNRDLVIQDFEAAEGTNPDHYFTIKGSGSSLEDIRDNATYLEVDCRGIKGFAIRVEVFYPRDWFVPDNDDGTIGDGQVKGYFQLSLRRHHAEEGDPEIPEPTEEDDQATRRLRTENWMVAYTMDPFQINGWEGWGFSVEEAWVDLSDLQNPEGMVFPERYDHPAISGDVRFRNTWTGFYMKRLSLRASGDFSTSAGRIEAGVHNMIIDPKFSGSFRISNLISTSEGEIDGWAFSIDDIHVDLVRNDFRQAGLNGKIGVPVMEAGEYLAYSANLQQRPRSGGSESSESSSSGSSSSTGGMPADLTDEDEDETEWAFVFTISPTDTVKLPLYVAQANLHESTYITIDYTTDRRAPSGSESEGSESSDPNDFEIEIHLDGSLTINSDLLGDGASSLTSSFNMQGMLFRFTYNSNSGFSDDHFSFASPQKSMSGFPLSIEQISLEADGLDVVSLLIEPRLVLAGDEGGFAASTLLAFNAQIPLGDKNFELIGVDVRAIEINVEVSAVRLDGRLEFYNRAGDKGVEGSLAVTMPMGIGAQLQAKFGTYQNPTAPDASFNTADYYSYWFVDAMVNFGNAGIVIFPGVAIYGIGGGVYYHMRKANSMPNPQAVLTGGNAESAAPRPSGVQYVRDYETLIGLRLSAIFGTAGNPDAFNCDVTLEAAFSNSGGLTYIGVVGNAYIMSSMTDRTDAKVWGNVSIEYHNPVGGQERVEGAINVFVHVGPLQGIGQDGEPYKMIGARFYADDAKWFFHAGSPDNRGGLALTVGDKTLAEFNGYLMVGYDIPTRIPDPPAQFMALLNGGGGKLGTEGAVQSALQAERPDWVQARISNGQGFAFGAGFSTDLDMRFFPLYVKLGFIVGFDINVSRDPTRICAESGIQPGIDDWYATGQMYAGIWGEMGVYVDLFFIKGEFPFLEASAAMLMRAGLPNPEWFEGRATVRYRVLNGLVKGSASFVVEIGEKCTPESMNPFGDMELITDLEPKGSEVSIFAVPTASFFLPMGEILEIPREGTMDGEMPPRRIEPYIYSFTLKKNNSESIPGTITMGEDNVIATLERTISLDPYTNYTSKVVARAREYFPNGNILDIRVDASNLWVEERSESFRTGEAPDHIDPDNILYSYPIDRQKFFLKGETQNNQGLLKMKQGQAYLFNEVDDEGIYYDFTARFMALDLTDTIEVPLVYNGGQIVNFNVSQLENEQYYAVQLVKSKRPVYNEFAETESAPGSVFTQIDESLLSNAVGNYRDLINQTPLFQLFDANYRMTVEGRKIDLPGPNVRVGETLLHHWHFKTSEYNTLRSKMNGLTWNSTSSRFITEYLKVESPLNEHFDRFDIYGYSRSGVTQLQPLVEFYIKSADMGEFETDPGAIVNRYITQVANPKVYSVQVLLDMEKHRNHYRYSQQRLGRHNKGVPPRRVISVTQNSLIDQPLSDWVLNAQVPQPQSSSSQPSNTYGFAIQASMQYSTSSYGVGGVGGVGGFFQASGFLQTVINTQPTFKIQHNASVYTYLDNQILRRNVARALSTSVNWVLPFPTYANVWPSQNPNLYNRCQEVLTRNIYDFNQWNYPNGQQSFMMKYRHPELRGWQIDGTSKRQTFYK